jgi:prepilin-type N-terminal cleavage/methylation domain-containing protein
MRRVSRGYTIVEVIIVLAVSGVILSAAILMFHGQQGKTEFTQGMRDIDSKIQNVAKDVTASVPTSSQACSVPNPADSTSRPVQSATTAPVGTNVDCIYLGNAVEATPGKDYLNIYTVLGRHDADSFLSANPTTMTAVTKYPIIGGSTILSSKTYDFNGSPSQNSSLVGIYLGMNSGDADRGSAGGPLFLRGYANSNGGMCVEQGSGCGVITAQVSKWSICFESPYSAGVTARLDIQPSSNGVTTQLDFGGCS